jgi:hypothetical protein
VATVGGVAAQQRTARYYVLSMYLGQWQSRVNPELNASREKMCIADAEKLLVLNGGAKPQPVSASLRHSVLPVVSH